MKMILCGGLGLFLTLFVRGQVRINELMASNTRAYPDITDFEDYPDWLELFNAGDEGVSLAGYFLSDDPEEPMKWQFASDSMIAAGEYLVVIADGNDAPLGASFVRSAWPFKSFSTEKYHTNFSLSSEGETLILSYFADQDPEVMVPTGATWSFLDDGSNLGVEWRSLDFDDSAWSQGPAPLGYGDDPATVLDFGVDDNRHITSYLRHQFDVVDPDEFTDMTLALQVDDGAVVYLNGTEIVRQNLPDGEIDFLTRASSAITPEIEEIFHQFVIPVENLVAGANILAVEVHQISSTSVDMRFDLQLEARSFLDFTELDRVTYSQQVSDVSFGRDPADESRFVNFTTSSPGAENSGGLVSDLRLTSGEASLSPRPGVYEESQFVSLTTTAAGNIHFTLDGSEPNENDPIYDEPIEISSPTAVRVRVINPGAVPGAILTGTYLIGESFSADVPILSIVAPPQALFDDRIGIYYNQHEPVQGVGPAVYKGKDAPGNLEFFPADGSEGFSVNGGFRMGGENNWASHFQRAFNFIIRGRYGDDELSYDLFPGREIPLFTALTIREGGDDYLGARMSDPIFDLIAEERLEVETNKSRPTEVFINGEYWGHYNLRDRWDENWFFQHYGTDVGEYDHIAFDTTSETSFRIQNGVGDTWTEFYDFVRFNDLNDPEVWAFVESRMEVDSFIDFIAAESWGNNTSWSGNREIWRPQLSGGKWRWFIPDMDRAFRATTSNEFFDMAQREQLFKFLRFNESFKVRLAQRYSAHLATTFASSRIHELVDEMGGGIMPTIGRTNQRWGNTSTLDSYPNFLMRMKNFATEREGVALAEVQELFELADPVNLILAVSGEGSVQIAGVDVPAMQLSMFPNLETEVEAIPAPGYQFDCWADSDAGAKRSLTFTEPTLLVAKFVPIETSLLGGVLSANTTLLEGAVYDVSEDLIVPEGVTLTISEGVTLRMDPSVHLRVMGVLNIVGSEYNPVTIMNRLPEPWGGLSFETPSSPSVLSHLLIRGATRGKDPTIYPSAISGLNVDLQINFLDIVCERGPLFFRGGSLELYDSVINIPITGDGVNVKQGAAITERCTFTGNDSPDTDAIDYDGVVDGVIRDCRIYNFRGFNSDGIDTGEQCVNCLVEGNTVYFCEDKGISVGQGSTIIARHNVIVGSLQGVGVKDSGSFISLDQNTFVDCVEAVAVFEKNFGVGGGSAVVTNCIFSGCEIPVSTDSLSILNVSYNLSDTIPLIGVGNQFSSPFFVDEPGLDFSLRAVSPAIDSGDPNHELDPDGTRADIGAFYLFDPEDYPFPPSDTVVVNEILANSGVLGDWIELHNRSQNSIDIGGWLLSDDGSDLEKYRFPEGTMIEGNAYLVLTEENNFGESSFDPAKIKAFALSATGETIHLVSPEGYEFSENFGSSEEGSTLGFYFRQSSNTYNFVAQQSPSQGFENGLPEVGPIVISEIMYSAAGDSGVEYLELLNISALSVTLFDSERNLPWSISDGIEFTFPIAIPLTMSPGQRVIITRDLNDFTAEFSPPEETLVFEWESGRLSNGGERVQLSRPGLFDDLGEPSLIRVDRVNYDNDAPWPTSADGTGFALHRKIEFLYGNDFINWEASVATPGIEAGRSSLSEWSAQHDILDLYADDDADGLANLLEYAIGSNPTSPNEMFGLVVTPIGDDVMVTYPTEFQREGILVRMEVSRDLVTWDLAPTVTEGDLQRFENPQEPDLFFRLNVIE